MPKKSPAAGASSSSKTTKSAKEAKPTKKKSKKTPHPQHHEAAIYEGESLVVAAGPWAEVLAELQKVDLKILRAVCMTVVLENDERKDENDAPVKVLSFTAGTSGDLAQTLMLTNMKVSHAIRELNEAEGKPEEPRVCH